MHGCFIEVTHKHTDTQLCPIWTFSLRGVLTFVASGLDINGCVLSYFEGTANLHCYTSCTLTTLHCINVSFVQCCHMKRYNKIFTKMWMVYSLMWDTVYIYIYIYIYMVKWGQPFLTDILAYQIVLPFFHYKNVTIVTINLWLLKGGRVGVCGWVCFQLVFFSQARDCTTFVLHDLTDC